MPSHELIRWRNAIFALFLVNGIVGATWASRLPAIREDTGASIQLMGFVLLAGSIGAISGLSLGPALMHRWGARRTLAVMFTGVLVAIGIIGLASSVFGALWLVAVGLALWGLTIGAADVVTNIEAAANERAIGKTLMPMMHGFFSIGTVLGALAGAAAAALHWSVLLNIAVMIALGTALLIWALPRVPEPEEIASEDATEHRRGVRKAWREPVVWLIGFGVLANGFAEGAAGDWIALGTVYGHGRDDATGALMMGAVTLGMTLMRFVGGPLVDRWGRVWSLRASALTAMVGISMFVWVNSFWLLLFACALWGVGVALGFPLGMSAAADHPNGPARVTVVSTLGYGAFLIGPPMLGLFGEHVGILNALTVLLGVLAVAFLVAPAARERATSQSSI